MYRFVVQAAASNQLATARDILNALQPKHYASEHVSTEEVDVATSLPHPGYHPYTENDEIHTDPENQIFFPTRSEGLYAWENEWYETNCEWCNDPKYNARLQPLPDPPPPPDDVVRHLNEMVERGPHGQLRSHVRTQRLWYVNLHTTKAKRRRLLRQGCDICSGGIAFPSASSGWTHFKSSLSQLLRLKSRRVPSLPTYSIVLRITVH